MLVRNDSTANEYRVGLSPEVTAPQRVWNDASRCDPNYALSIADAQFGRSVLEKVGLLQKTRKSRL